MPRHWLMKSEPDEARSTTWRRAPADAALDRRAQLPGAQLHARRHAPGDGVLFYHSSCPQPGVAGLAASSAAWPRPHAVRPRQPLLHDPKSTPDQPRWLQIDVRLVRKTRCCRCRDARRTLAGHDAGAAARQPAVDHAGHAAEWQAVLALLGR
jgi:predicted RNA-binding protein with PUA-like domain